MQCLTKAEVREAIDATVFVSTFQQREVDRAFGPLRKARVIANGIAPAFENMFASPHELLKAKKNRAAYTTTPYRGLSVLVRAMQGFESSTTLDLFSSMRVYQSTDEEYASLFAMAAKNPAIILHGAVSQSELAKPLRACAFLFYPSIYAETFCISAAEAMAAGMKIVSTDLGALSETTKGFADLVPLTSHDGDGLVRAFQQAMGHAVKTFVTNPIEWAQERFAQVQSANQSFSWAALATKWEAVNSRET